MYLHEYRGETSFAPILYANLVDLDCPYNLRLERLAPDSR